MSVNISIRDEDNRQQSFVFEKSDWQKLCTLAGRSSGQVTFSKGSAQLVDGTLVLTLKSPGGQRQYFLSPDQFFA